mmetsp:Transcript_7982/g.21149  ORF Transcript_7982/g.21149 Transcript_7982/m.21149 type:complete len:109 (+) Transcript_7982:1082-1408(+)
MRSQSAIVLSRCAMKMEVEPALSALILARIDASVAWSSELVASSQSHMRGFFSIARAIATRCFSPPDSLSPRSPTSVSYPCGNCITRSWIEAARAADSTLSELALKSP